MSGDGGAASIAILGGGNLGRALGEGWVKAGRFSPEQVWMTRRRPEKLADLAEAGYQVGADNRAALEHASTLVLAVLPQQLEDLLGELRGVVDPALHRVVSVVSGVTIEQIFGRLGVDAPIVRAMPNTAVSIGESMTCLAAGSGAEEALNDARALFDLVGHTLVVPEEMMVPATALCACGVAFFLRAIRAASQGGIEIGFHPEEAMTLAAQTAKGAASLLMQEGKHPEAEIDRVTSPRGCTIAGLNEMEHQGLSSAMIKGILLSSNKAAELFGND